MKSRHGILVAYTLVVVLGIALAGGCYSGPLGSAFEEGLTECEQACGPQAGDRHRACLEAGGSEDACRAEADEAYLACVEACGSPGNDSQDDCGAASSDDLDLDPDQPGAGDEPESDDLPSTEGGTEADASPAEQPGDTGDAQDGEESAFDSACPVACPDYAYLVYNQCLDQGGESGACERAFEDAYAWCRATCEGAQGEPGPTLCEETCQDSASAEFEECMLRVDDPAVCEDAAGDVMDACTENCEQPPREPECEETCHLDAEAQLEACLAGAEAPEVCQQTFDVMLDACIDGCAETSPAECEQGCHEEGERLFDECLASGVPEDECRERVEAEIDACLEACRPGDCEQTGEGDADSGGSGVGCSTRCEEYAYEVYLECVEDPGRDDCEFLFETAFDGCLIGCGFASESDGACLEDGP